VADARGLSDLEICRQGFTSWKEMFLVLAANRNAVWSRFGFSSYPPNYRFLAVWPICLFTYVTLQHRLVNGMRDTAQIECRLEKCTVRGFKAVLCQAFASSLARC
jgi:hypothetical protein